MPCDANTNGSDSDPIHRASAMAGGVGDPFAAVDSAWMACCLARRRGDYPRDDRHRRQGDYPRVGRPVCSRCHRQAGRLHRGGLHHQGDWRRRHCLACYPRVGRRPLGAWWVGRQSQDGRRWGGRPCLVDRCLAAWSDGHQLLDAWWGDHQHLADHQRWAACLLPDAGRCRAVSWDDHPCWESRSPAAAKCWAMSTAACCHPAVRGSPARRQSRDVPKDSAGWC